MNLTAPMPNAKRLAIPPDLKRFLAKLDVCFDDPRLLEQAMIHRSYYNEHKGQNPHLKHNERLEFLGDAILEFIAGEWLYHQFPTMREGDLTLLRSALVRTEMLADFAHVCDVNHVVRLGKGLEDNGGRQHKRILAGVFEALVGALYLDQGIEAVREMIEILFQAAMEDILEKISIKDAKSRLQEWSQSGDENLTPSYYTLAEYGPGHAKLFVAEVRLNEQAIGWGTGWNKRHAEQVAAQNALDELGIMPEEYPHYHPYVGETDEAPPVESADRRLEFDAVWTATDQSQATTR